MLTQQEKDFVDYWEKNRSRQKKLTRQFLLGIPIGLLFVIPMLINLFSGWHKRASMDVNSVELNPGLLLIAMLFILAFFAIFSSRLQWERNEQKYKELQAKKDFVEPDSK
jgi:hypothetical protein